MNALRWIYALVLLGIGAVLGHRLPVSAPLAAGDPAKPGAANPAQTVRVGTPGKEAGLYRRQSPGNATADSHEPDFGLGENHASKLIPYPPGGPGVKTPLDLWRYSGKGTSSWGSPDLGMPFAEWVKWQSEQKPGLMAEVQAYMNARYDFSGKAIGKVAMTRGKPIMKGPVAPLLGGVGSFDEL